MMIPLLSVAALALAAAASPAPTSRILRAPTGSLAPRHADTAWTAGRADTLAGVAVQVETQGTRARLRLRNTRDGTELITPDVAADSLAGFAAVLTGTATAKAGAVSALGNTIAASNASQGGTPAVGLFFGDATSDRMLQFAVTLPETQRLAALLRSAARR